MEILKKKSNIILLVIMVAFLITGIVFFILGSIPVKEYKVEFDSIGGSAVSTLVVPKNMVIEAPEDPIKEGYIFKGWYFGNDLFDFNTKIKKDLLLVAHWEEVKEEIDPLALDIDTLELKVGENYTLEANRSENIVWESSDNLIATVADGVVTALKEGVVTITVRDTITNEEASCEVTIINNPNIIAVNKIDISGENTVMVGSSIKLEATISPNNATNKKISWRSSDKTIATVDELGNVVGLKEGSVTITATASNGKKASLIITVIPEVVNNEVDEEKEEEKKITSVNISGPRELKAEENYHYTFSYEPADANYSRVAWDINNKDLATVDADGNVRVNENAVSGSFTLTVTLYFDTTTGTEAISATYDVTISGIE